MITNKQKAYLKGLANGLSSIFQIGKDGVTPNVINTIDDALKAHELIKINVLKTSPQEMQEVAIEISAHTHCEVVQIIGRVIVLYRKNKEKQRIVLPK